MTTSQLSAALTPIAERFASDTARLSDAQEHQPAHAAASILCFLMHALDAANAGRPELLLTLCRRVGFVPGVVEMVKQ